jgi:hypothetical protein
MLVEKGKRLGYTIITTPSVVLSLCLVLYIQPIKNTMHILISFVVNRPIDKLYVSMFTNRSLLIRRLPSSLIVWRHNQTNPATQISTSHSQELYKWNIAMTESNKRKNPQNTLVLFDKLITKHPDITPNFITYLLALSACIRLGNLCEGKRIHEYIRQRWSTTVETNEEIKIHTCLMQLYATCGDLKIG